MWRRLELGRLEQTIVRHVCADAEPRYRPGAIVSQLGLLPVDHSGGAPEKFLARRGGHYALRGPSD
jgi:hypothetical protein